MTYEETKNQGLKEFDESFIYELVEMNLGRDMHNRPPLYETKSENIDEIKTFCKSFLTTFAEKIRGSMVKEIKEEIEKEKAKQKEPKSKCCKTAMENECADEGTCYYWCLSCGNACDPAP